MKKRKPKNPKPAPAVGEPGPIVFTPVTVGLEAVALELEKRIAMEAKVAPELVDAYLRVHERLGKQGDFEALRGELKALRDRVALLESVRGVNRSPATSTPGGLRLG